MPGLATSQEARDAALNRLAEDALGRHQRQPGKIKVLAVLNGFEWVVLFSQHFNTKTNNQLTSRLSPFGQVSS